MPRCLRRALSLAAAIALAGLSTAGAAVVTEAEGQFSRDWSNPTEISVGAETILGTAEVQNGHEFILLTGLRPGYQTLSFELLAPEWALNSHSYSAGGKILWRAGPFRHPNDGTRAGSFQLSRRSPAATVDVVLGDDFAGPLHLGVYFTHGSDVSWSLSVPGNAASMPPAAPAPVPLPLPAGMWLMAGGVSVLALLGLRRRRQG